MNQLERKNGGREGWKEEEGVRKKLRREEGWEEGMERGRRERGTMNIGYHRITKFIIMTDRGRRWHTLVIY